MPKCKLLDVKKVVASSKKPQCMVEPNFKYALHTCDFSCVRFCSMPIYPWICRVIPSLTEVASTCTKSHSMYIANLKKQ